MNLKSASLLLLSLTLIACGGGGGGTDQPETVAPPVTPPSSGGENTATGAAAIKVPTGFDFATSKALTVSVELGGAVPTNTYLTVCQSKADGNTANFDNCLVRSPVTAGTYATEISVPNDVDVLIAELWSLDTASVMQSVQWQRSGADMAAIRFD